MRGHFNLLLRRRLIIKRSCWSIIVYDQLIFKLWLVKVYIGTGFLRPTCLIIKVDKFSTLKTKLLVICITYFWYLVPRLSFPKPCMVLLMKHPIFPLKLHSCQILLISPLLVVERKEQCFQIKLHKILPLIVHRYCWEHVLLSQWYWMLSFLHLLILWLRDIPVWGV
jgi:hypothetical protein